MHRFLSTVFFLCLVTPSLAAHGGAYRGPGTSGGSGPSTGAAEDGGDSAAWSQWWALNRLGYLGLSESGSDTLSGSDEFFLGLGQARSNSSLQPDPDRIRDRVVPALLRSLDSRDVDRRTAALMALAKIGQEMAGPDVDLTSVFSEHLRDPHQQVHETAALALGVTAQPGSSLLLVDLLMDRPEAHVLCGRSSIPVRTRAFAAYGLGLTGVRSEAPSVRRFVSHHLSRLLEESPQPHRDPGTAAVISMGLVPLPIRGLDLELVEEMAPSPGHSVEGQCALLLDLLERDAAHTIDGRIRAQIPVALARLARSRPGAKIWLAPRLVHRVERHGVRATAVPHGAIEALGLLGDNDDDDLDIAIREALFKVSRTGDRTARNLSLLSLARISARHGDGPRGETPELVRSHLLQRLARGKMSERPWAGLAIGLLGHGLRQRGQILEPDLRAALRGALASTKNPSQSSAYAIALGLAGDPRALSPLLELIGEGDLVLRGHAATALGLLGQRQAIEPLQQVLDSSHNQYQVMREVAIALALLGDREAAPVLMARLAESEATTPSIGYATALIWVGDGRCVEALVQRVEDERGMDLTRAFAAVALGAICDRARLPWNTGLAAHATWYEAPTSLLDPLGGSGILDIY